MIDLNLKNEELKNIFKESKVIGSGFFGTCIIYRDMFFKVDSRLFELHKINMFNNTDWCYEERTRWEKVNFCNEQQISTLANTKLELTKTPLGIIRVGNDPIGIILNYFDKHYDIKDLNDPSKLKEILTRLLYACKELEDNHIAQEDFKFGLDFGGSTNVLVRDNIPQIIDMEGPYVKCGSEYTDSSIMYKELSELISYLYNKLGIINILDYQINNSLMVKDQIKELEKLR